MVPFLEAIPTIVVVDHMGRSSMSEGPEGPQVSAFKQLLDEQPKNWTKVACPDRLHGGGERGDDVAAAGRRSGERQRERGLGGRERPHPKMEGKRTDDGHPDDSKQRRAGRKERKKRTE